MSDVPLDEPGAAPTDVTVDMSARAARSNPATSPDVTAWAEPTGTDPDPDDYWRPAARLDSRVEASRRQPAKSSTNRPWWIAGAIVVAAVIVAVALWLVALWIQSSSDDDNDPPVDDAAAAVVDSVTIQTNA